MKLRRGVFLLIFMFVTIGMVSFMAPNAEAQSRFDSGDSTDDADSSTSTDSSDFDSGDDSSDSDTSDTSSSDQDSTTQQSQTESTDDSDRFDSGDGEDDSGDSSDRFDSGDSEDDSGDSQDRFDSGDDQDDSTTSEDQTTEENPDRFDSGDSEDDAGPPTEDEEDDEEDQEDQEDEDTEDGDQDTPSDGDRTGTGGNVIVVEPLNISDEDMSIQVSPQQVASGQQVTVTGQVDSDKSLENIPVAIVLNGRQVDTAELDSNGRFTATIASDQSGTNTVAVELRDASAVTTFEVSGAQAGDLQILGITTSGVTAAGQSIQVCPRIQAPSDAEVRFYANGDLQDTRTGVGELCFNHVLEQGSNTFTVEASQGGSTVSDSITRTTGTLPGGDDGVQGGVGEGITGQFATDPLNLPDIDAGDLGLRWLFSIVVAALLAAGILL